MRASSYEDFGMDVGANFSTVGTEFYFSVGAVMRSITGGIFALLFFAGALFADFGEPYGARWERTFCPPPGIGGNFNDLFLLRNGRIALCGAVKMTGLVSHGWLFIMGADGNRVRDVLIEPSDVMARRKLVEYFTLIQTDDGGFLLGGKEEAGQKKFLVTKFSSQGDVQWSNSYASQVSVGPCCYAVIELKEGDLIVCGQGTDGQALAMRLNSDGGVIWQQYYPGITLNAVRETEDGLAFARHSNASGENGLLLTDFAGAIVASKRIGPGIPLSLIRSPDDGYVIPGKAPGRNGFALEISEGLNVNWRTLVDLNSGNANDYPQFMYGIAVNYDGYMVVGNLENVDAGPVAAEMFLDLQGNPVWGRRGRWTANQTLKRSLRSVVTDHDGAFIACGSYETAGPPNLPIGYIVAYEPVAHKPFFVELSPEDSTLKGLAGDEFEFRALAEDPDGDEVFYTWKIENEVVDRDTSMSVVFDQVGEYRVVCIISDGEFSDSTDWMVTTSNFYIRSHNPDTLNLRTHRNVELQFTVDPRGNQDLPYTYMWLLSTPGQGDVELISEQQEVFHLFEFVGMHQLSALVGQGDYRDIVTWQIRVEAALARWFPVQQDLDVLIGDSLTFGIVPVDSESVEWRIRWTLDDERIGGRRTETIVFNRLGIHELTGRIEQNDMVDTVRWYIMVNEPVNVNDPFITPTEFGYSLSPNPFNELTRIVMALPEAAMVNVSLYDPNGRFIRRLENRWYENGKQSLSFDAGGLAAGVYILRLEAGEHHGMMKAVLIR